MIRITQNRKGNKEFGSVCPFCFADIVFAVSAPVFCYKCSEELPPITEFMEYLDYRIDYHFHGIDRPTT